MLRKISTIDFKSSNTTSGKTVLIRVDYNVPVENELVTDDYRILKSIPTIKYCLDQGAKVVLMSHMGRPKGKVDSKYSLIPAGEKLAELLEMPIKFSEDCISEDAIDVSKNLKDGEIHLLENLRFYNEYFNSYLGENNISNYDNVSNYSNTLIRHKEHVWTNKYSILYILPWRLSEIFYAEYGAYADREYMLLHNDWSRIIEGTHAIFCGFFGVLSLLPFN